MLAKSVLFVVGHVCIWAGSWPVLRILHEGPRSLLPGSPKFVINVAAALALFGICALVAAFFFTSIHTWSIIISAFAAGPFGGELGMKYVLKREGFLVMQWVGIVGVGLVIFALLY
jgi:hypothetical protein